VPRCTCKRRPRLEVRAGEALLHSTCRVKRARSRAATGRRSAALAPSTRIECACSCCGQRRAPQSWSPLHVHLARRTGLLTCAAGVGWPIGRRDRARAAGIRHADLRHARRPSHRPRCAGPAHDRRQAAYLDPFAPARQRRSLERAWGFSRRSSACSPGKASRLCCNRHASA